MSDRASLGLGCARRWVDTVLPLLVSFAGSLPTAEAGWKITTYLHPTGNPPIFSMREAELYFAGVKPQRFTGSGSAALLDFWEGGSPGRFDINNEFPGLDNDPGTFPENFTARITGSLNVETAGSYDFTAFNTLGTRFRLDVDQNGSFEDLESILPGVIPTDPPGYRPDSDLLTLNTGNYPFEISYFRSSGFSNLEVAYRRNGEFPRYLLGDATGGIGLLEPATVHTVGAAVTEPEFNPLITNFALADALRTGVNEPGFPVTESREAFNILDTIGAGQSRLQGKQSAPGLGPPNFDDDSNFLVVGTGLLVVPPGGISNAIFRSTTDDGGRLLIDRNRDGDFLDAAEVVIFDDTLHPTQDVFSGRPIALAEGRYPIEYSFFELAGGAEGAIAVSIGGGFTLLGDDAAVAAGTGLDVVPEPSSFALAALAILAIGAASRSLQKRR